MLTSWIIRILLVLILIRLLWRFVAKVRQSLVNGVQQSAATAAALVRDPVCGTYVLPARAVVLHAEGGTKYFCSERCRQTWKRQSA